MMMSYLSYGTEKQLRRAMKKVKDLIAHGAVIAK